MKQLHIFKTKQPVNAIHGFVTIMSAYGLVYKYTLVQHFKKIKDKIMFKTIIISLIYVNIK